MHAVYKKEISRLFFHEAPIRQRTEQDIHDVLSVCCVQRTVLLHSLLRQQPSMIGLKHYGAENVEMWPLEKCSTILDVGLFLNSL